MLYLGIYTCVFMHTYTHIYIYVYMYALCKYAYMHAKTISIKRGMDIKEM